MKFLRNLKIKKYIKNTVNWRNNHGGQMILKTQLNMKRIEVIMVGRFLKDNSKFEKYEIISIDNKLPNSTENYRPDLIIKNISTAEIIHIEIDENNHSGYSKSKEIERNKYLENYFQTNYPKNPYRRIRFNPNIYKNKYEMAKSFSNILMNLEIVTEFKII